MYDTARFTRRFPDYCPILALPVRPPLVLSYLLSRYAPDEQPTIGGHARALQGGGYGYASSTDPYTVLCDAVFVYPSTCLY